MGRKAAGQTWCWHPGRPRPVTVPGVTVTGSYLFVVRLVFYCNQHTFGFVVLLLSHLTAFNVKAWFVAAPLKVTGSSLFRHERP